MSPLRIASLADHALSLLRIVSLQVDPVPSTEHGDEKSVEHVLTPLFNVLDQAQRRGIDEETRWLSHRVDEEMAAQAGLDRVLEVTEAQIKRIVGERAQTGVRLRNRAHLFAMFLHFTQVVFAPVLFCA